MIPDFNLYFYSNQCDFLFDITLCPIPPTSYNATIDTTVNTIIAKKKQLNFPIQSKMYEISLYTRKQSVI